MARAGPIAVAGALLLLGGASAVWWLSRESCSPPPAAKAPARVPSRPRPPPPSVRLTDAERKDVVAKFKAYLDPETENGTKARTALMTRVRELKDAQKEILSDVDLLREVLYAARPFEKPLEKKSLPKEWMTHVDDRSGVVSIQADASEYFRAAYLLPSKYPKDQKALNAMPPFPMIVTLHDVDDYKPGGAIEPYPGEHVIKRRYPRASMKAVTDDWIVFAPIAPQARFTVDGRIDSDKVLLARMWKSYHVDFDRFVIDGGSDALIWAAAQPVFYAGVIVRGDAADVPPAIVRNFAHLQVYVVGTEASAAKKSLLAGGMSPTNIRVGNEGGIAAWLNAKDASGKAVVRRTTPTRFERVVQDRQAHRLALWVNIDEIDPAVEVPTMSVEVVDTEENPNTVKITSTGVRNVTLFLNDRVVDLARPVRIVANGVALAEGKIQTMKPSGLEVKLPAKIDRSADVTFDTNRSFSIRRTMYYGWLYPVVLSIRVEGTSGGGSEEDEFLAKQYFEAALQHVADGDVAKARRNFSRAIDVGETSYKEKAQAELKKLQGR